MSDNELIAQLVESAQEDSDKFDELYESIVNKIYFWCYNAVNNRETARDLTQEAMVLIAKSINKLDHPENFVVWSYVITKNVCKKYHRDSKNSDKVIADTEEVYDSLVSNIEDDSIEYHPERKFKESSRNELIVNFVDNLPKKQKEVIVLFYLEELSINEIATALDAKIPTVKSNLFSGRKNLEKQISEYQESTGVRLYDKSIFIILGSILLNYRNIICTNVDITIGKEEVLANLQNTLAQSKSTAASTSAAGASKLGGWLSTHLVAVIATTVVAATVLVGAVAASTYAANNTGNQENESSVNGLEKNSMIKRIEIEENPVDASVPITIRLKENFDESQISIYSTKNEEIPFDYKDKTITLQVKQNGSYQIQVKDEVASFQVRSFKTTPPEILGVKKEEGYVHIDIDDKGSAVDYEKSYVIIGGQEYPITSDNKVHGDFSGEVSVYIYNASDQFVSGSYSLE